MIFFCIASYKSVIFRAANRDRFNFAFDGLREFCTGKNMQIKFYYAFEYYCSFLEENLYPLGKT